MISSLTLLVPFLAGIAHALPQRLDQGGQSSSIEDMRNVSSSASSITSRASSPKSNPAPSKSGCLWDVPGVGSFTQMSNFNFERTSLPTGLQINAYPVQDKAPFQHSYTRANVYLRDGFLNLKVPGKQTKSPIKCAEVQTGFADILYASVRTRAIFTDVPGTCAGIFFYKDDTQEIDIEYLSDPSSLSNDPNKPWSIPIQYTNQAVVPGTKATYSTGPPPWDVTAVHEYRIDWVPGRTSFYLDGVLQKEYTDNVPTQAGPWIWNHWTNGDQGWSVGPPKADAVFKIQNIEMYYNRTSTAGTCGK